MTEPTKEPTKDYNLEAQRAIIDAELAMEYEENSNEYRQALAQLAIAKAIMALAEAIDKPRWTDTQAGSGSGDVILQPGAGVPDTISPIWRAKYDA